MKVFLINIISGLSILIPALLILFRWRRISSAYYPFAILLWVGALNEIVSLALIMTSHSNLINSNVYVLIEFIIIVWQFSVWNKWPKLAVYILTSFALLLWGLDNIILHSVADNNSLFRMIYSVVVIGLSMHTLSQKLITERNPALKNPVILICLSFILFYSLKAYCESFNVFLPDVKMSFYYNLWIILSVVGLFSNLIYTLSIICIRKTVPFTLPY